jgi:protein-S-isoprenylcysteine O-methyltransferase Ste14
MPWQTIDVALWGVLALLWLVAAPFARKTVRSEGFVSRVRYLVPALAGAAVLTLRLPFLGDRWLPDAPWVGALSVALTAIGVAHAAWARLTLGRNWSGTVTVKEGHELVQRGPYALTRHPIYTGALLAFAGTVIGVGTARALLAIVPVVLALRGKMRLEERFMTEQFGEAYTAYRARVKALVPFVW